MLFRSRVVPLSLARKIEEARVLEEKARQLPQIRAQIASALVARGVSTRDAAWMMGGVSHQRVHQLATVGAKANGPGRNHKKAIRGRRRTGTVRKA